MRHTSASTARTFDALAEQVTGIFDIGESLDVAQSFLPTLLDCRASGFILYRRTARTCETRIFAKKKIYQKEVDLLVSEATKLIRKPSQPFSPAVRKAPIASPMISGTVVQKEPKTKKFYTLTLPITVGKQQVGALAVLLNAPLKKKRFACSLIQALLRIAALSAGRIETLLQSQKTGTASLIRGLSNGVIMFSKQRQVLIANPAAVQHTGLPSEGYNLDELVTLFTGTPLNTMIDAALSKGTPGHVQQVHVAPFYYEVHVTPLHSTEGAITGGAIVLHDITHIVEIDKMKTEFVSVAAHQLRTPLTSMKWFLEMLMNEDAGTVNETQKKYLDEVFSGGERMLEMVNGLLNVSRLEAGRVAINPAPASIEAVIDGAVKESTPGAKEARATITFTRPKPALPTLPLDTSLLHEVINNLISNACRYGRHDGTGTVTVSLEKQGGKALNTKEWTSFSKPYGLINEKKYIVTRVTDNGIGIPREARGKIFTKFFRATNATEASNEGTGLGLYIIKLVAETAGGSVWFESEEGKGTTFYVAIPEDGMKEKEGERGLASRRKPSSEEK